MKDDVVGGKGQYTGYESLLELVKTLGKRLPKSVNFKVERSKYLHFRITMPMDGRRVVKPSGCDLTDTGLYEALGKAEKIADALSSHESETAFWDWYDVHILNKNSSRMVRDKTTYREIFTAIENKYWDSRNKNTGRKRSKDIPNDVATWNVYYGIVFKKFSNWDRQPMWDEMKKVLYSWEAGTKSFKDAYFVIKRIIELCPNKSSLMTELSQIDATQQEFREGQSISLEAYLAWHHDVLTMTTLSQHDEARQWLWVCSMCVLYGLRPSEIGAILNLDKPYSDKGVIIKALNDASNDTPLVVLGDRTYWGVTIKTGKRICRPMSSDERLWDELCIFEGSLPTWMPTANAKAEDIRSGFSRKLAKFLKRYKCPVTQAYAFRHLANQLGEMNGIPQEIRARSLGHSTVVNDSVYKARENTKTTVDLLTKHASNAISKEVAIQRIREAGIDVNSHIVKTVLAIIYS